MTKFEHVKHSAGTRAAGGSGLLSRLRVVLFAAAFSLAQAAVTVAQQPAQAGALTRNSAAARAAGADAIRPFRVNVPEAELSDLRRRVLATRWPERETVADQSQGVQLAKLQALVRYWGKDYDWRKAEAKLNALPQFVTEIDGLDIHFIFTRTEGRDATPTLGARDAQAAAILEWGVRDFGKLSRLESIRAPTLVANGDDDVMVPTVNSYLLAGHIPDARLTIYPDANHGFLFQYPHEFAAEVNAFLDE
jgi:pimeloyl-ACP methyl ester carboxylesterase